VLVVTRVHDFPEGIAALAEGAICVRSAVNARQSRGGDTATQLEHPLVRPVGDVHGRLLELPAALSAARTASVARPTLASAPLTNWSSRAAVPSAAGFSSHVRSGPASCRVQVEVDPELGIEFGDLKLAIRSVVLICRWPRFRRWLPSAAARTDLSDAVESTLERRRERRSGTHDPRRAAGAQKKLTSASE
jgi:hypothetical protein